MKFDFKYFFVVIGVIVTSMFLFPITLKAIPFVNTKQFLAVIGVIIIGLRLSMGKGYGNGFIGKDFSRLFLASLLVSLMGVFSVTVNHTPDYTYAGYILSFLVWISAAYAVYSYIKAVHGKISISIIANYLIAVCVAQCILALWIDLSPHLKDLVDYYIEQDQDFLNSNMVKRLYGIGASLDTAGTRFSIALVLISFLIFELEKTQLRKYLPYYLLSFAIITIIGNMIARTTIIGVAFGIIYICFNSWKRGIEISSRAKRIWTWVFTTLLIVIPLTVYYYDNDPLIHKHIRFAFEGFFSLVEKGAWEVDSNEKLKAMYVFPETIKTWVIGDGYFVNPRLTDPYFIGKIYGGYYMGTDVGYLRFIFYFGTIGLLLMTNVLYLSCRTCYLRFTNTRILFLMMFLTNLIIWFKVATDIFLVFALFLCVSKEENDEYMKSIALESGENENIAETK